MIFQAEQQMLQQLVDEIHDIRAGYRKTHTIVSSDYAYTSVINHLKNKITVKTV